MAELHVEPKKKSSVIPWILLFLGVAALIWFLMNRNKTTDTVVTGRDSANQNNTAGNRDAWDWNRVKFNLPSVSLDEIKSKIDVRGNDEYTIYGVNEGVLFDENAATIRSDASESLKEIKSSIDKRFQGADVRVYGFTDAQGSAGYNKELAEKRAKAVSDWMQQNGVEGSRLSVHPVGEAQPVASNETEAGRQQNRRVEIVAHRK